MKSTGTQYWERPDKDATNSSGFSGLPSGFHASDGSFRSIGGFGYWWSSSDFITGQSWNRQLGYGSGSVYRAIGYKNNGLSVRCLRD